MISTQLGSGVELPYYTWIGIFLVFIGSLLFLLSPGISSSTSPSKMKDWGKLRCTLIENMGEEGVVSKVTYLLRPIVSYFSFGEMEEEGGIK